MNKRRVFISGAARGIGRATARAFYESGSELVLMDVLPAKEAEVYDEFTERMTYLQVDITKPDDLMKIEAQMKIGVDVLINNAGITRDATMLKMSDEQWDSVIDVNLKSVFKLSQMAAKIMKEKKAGAILNAASVVAHYGNFGQANYVASKAGVIGMTKTMARELGRYGVRVNAVAPGFIATEMVQKMPEKVIAMMEEKAPLGKLGRPEDIAEAYLFLASDQAAFITGTTLNVDGGLSL